MWMSILLIVGLWSFAMVLAYAACANMYYLNRLSMSTIILVGMIASCIFSTFATILVLNV